MRRRVSGNERLRALTLRLKLEQGGSVPATARGLRRGRRVSGRVSGSFATAS